MSSPETPITVAPSAWNLSIDSANSCASAEQPTENAAGKKYSTTGPFASESANENWNTLPPSAASVVKFGAGSPTSSADHAGVTSATSSASAENSLFIGDSEPGS